MAIKLVRDRLAGGAHGEGRYLREARALASVESSSIGRDASARDGADFGLAKPVRGSGDGELSLTGDGLLLGTPAYLAPEQARGQKVDFRADIYSLGCVLFEMLTGTQSFRGPSVFAVVDQHLHSGFPSLRERRPDLPANVVEIADRMTRRERGERPGSYAELRSRIAAFEAGAMEATIASGERDPVPASQPAASLVWRERPKPDPSSGASLSGPPIDDVLCIERRSPGGLSGIALAILVAIQAVRRVRGRPTAGRPVLGVFLALTSRERRAFALAALVLPVLIAVHQVLSARTFFGGPLGMQDSLGHPAVAEALAKRVGPGADRGTVFIAATFRHLEGNAKAARELCGRIREIDPRAAENLAALERREPPRRSPDLHDLERAWGRLDPAAALPFWPPFVLAGCSLEDRGTTVTDRP